MITGYEELEDEPDHSTSGESKIKVNETEQSIDKIEDNV
jgi:hypothetical protein